MGKHRSKDERLAAQQAWMREQQRLRNERSPAAAEPVVVGYGFGVPLPPRSRRQMKKAFREHRVTNRTITIRVEER